jgi:hypothetical protein
MSSSRPVPPAAVPRLVEVLLRIDELWLERYPLGPENGTIAQCCPDDIRSIWSDLREELEAADVLRYDEMPHTEDGDIDEEQLARDQAATQAARRAHALRETLIDIARTGAL